MKTRAAVFALTLTLLMSALSGLSAQSPPENTHRDQPAQEVQISASQPTESPLVASGWCALQSSTGPGCDVGIGLALASYHRLSWVAVIGSKTIGIGLGWVVYKPSSKTGFQHTLALALGVVSTYNSKTGVARKVYPALGATIAFNPGG